MIGQSGMDSDDWIFHDWAVQGPGSLGTDWTKVSECTSVVLQSRTENSLLSSDVTYLKLSRNDSISVSMTCGAT